MDPEISHVAAAAANNNNNNKSGGGGSRKPPSAEEVLSHYESQGMEPREASLKAISDLQLLLYRTVATSNKAKLRPAGGNKDTAPAAADPMKKMKNLNTRLAILEMKVDSKPGYPETLALGLTSGLAAQGIGAALPHVLGALSNIWNAVSSATNTSPSSSSS